MNQSLPWRSCATTLSLVLILSSAPKSHAVDALLLQDTYVDNGTTGGKPTPNNSNYGSGTDLRIFKGNGRIGRTFLKFSLGTLPPGTAANDVTQARLRFWVNNNTTVLGAITMSPVTSAWDELALKDTSTPGITFGVPKLSDLPINYSTNFVSIDVTDWVKAWLAGTLVNEGFEIEASAGTSTLNLAFDSKESDQTSHEPRLEISLSKIGPPGLAGPQGPQGISGTAGPPGPIGLTGPAGSQGPAGPPGSQGPMGLVGATGQQGVAGPIGSKGDKGDAGVAGPQGTQGIPGPIGPEGSAGPVGLNWRGTYDAATSYAMRDLVSQDGASYLSIADNNIGNSMNDTSKWSLLAARGTSGATGEAGIQGLPGPAGPAGGAGPQGVAGAPGSMGSPGPAGPGGDIGPAGPAGPQGPAAVWPTHILPQGDLSMGEFTQGQSP
jgi:hypothetical protein